MSAPLVEGSARGGVPENEDPQSAPERTGLKGLLLGSFDYWETLVRMKNSAGKFDLRLRLVQFALKQGVKPAARAFAL